jgi:cytochrome c oxidase assembly protein subunit 15
MRVTIQLAHRFGALIVSTFLLLTVFILKRFSKENAISYYSNFANWLLFLLITQISLGVINVKLALPLATAVLHNSIACLLLISLITLNYKVNIKDKN